MIENPAPAAPVCPVTADRLAPKDKRYVDFAGPAMGRLMAAKALVPMQPADMAHVLFMLTFDPDPKVRDQALATVKDDKSAKILTPALKEEGLDPKVLDFYGHALAGKDALLHILALNNTTLDETLAHVVLECSAPLAETISQNQIRFLRHDPILRNLCSNPNASKATVDLACDFAVRSGVVMDDLPAMKEARIRIHGPDALPPPPEEVVTAAQMLAEDQELAVETPEGAPEAAPMGEQKRLTLTQKLMKMNVAEKIKLATLGNKEARTLLLRETNKLVLMATLKSPRITDGEIYLMANNKTASNEALAYIYGSREWTKNYKIKLALIKNPKVPAQTAIKFLATLRDADLKDLAKEKSVPSAVQMMARKMVEKKNAPVKVGGEGH
jgi:hypothetical protein